MNRWEGPGLDAWAPWHPETVAERLSAVEVPWCVVGGWALDLWLGYESRSHGDIEIAVPRRHFLEVRKALSPLEPFAVGRGGVAKLAPDGRMPEDHDQCWVLDPEVSRWRLDVMLEPGDDCTWVYRRDERLRAPRSAMVGYARGIPYLKPQGVLLYKAKAVRDKDQGDFDRCIGKMGTQAKRWLADALDLVHPDHGWIEPLRMKRQI